jgi:hypothetical protein
VRSEAKTPLRIALLASLFAIAAFALSSAPAFAANHVLSDSFGSPGSGAGQLRDPEAIDVHEASGDIYVADTGNRRISRFDSDGNFILSWGNDVVATGPEDSSVDEQQEVTVAATAGTFTLGFEDPFSGGGSQQTAPIPFNAAPAEVKSALEALSTIGGLGGTVSVSGGPGDASGSTPYLIAFESVLGGDDVPELTIDASGLTPDPSASTVATASAGGDFEVCKAGVDACKAGVIGTEPLRFFRPSRIAVDNSGDPSDGNIYVASTTGEPGEPSNVLVEKYSSEGVLLSTNDGKESGGAFLGVEEFFGLAVSSEGDLYVNGSGPPPSRRTGVFTEAGSFVKLVKGGGSKGLAVDSPTNSLYLNWAGGDVGVIRVDYLTGKFFNVASTGPHDNSNITFEPASGALYVSFPDHVERYDPSQNTVNLQEEFGEGDLANATAIAAKADSFQTTYVTDAGSDEVKVFASPVLPDPKTGDVTDVGTSNATLHGTVDPNGVKTSYQFEYVEESAFEASGFTTASKAPVPAGDAGEGDEAIDVSEELTGLEPGKTYRWRLSAANTLASAIGATKSFTTPEPVRLGDTFASGVGTTSAVANATIDPGGAQTTYRVEYGTTPAYGKVAPVPDASAGSGTAGLQVSQALQGLKPDTTYHFRFVAENIGGPVLSEDETFHTFVPEAPGLPDGRAWEMVSPPNKNGGSVATRPDYTRVASDGDAIVFPSVIAFADSLGTNGNGNEYIAKRGPDGWATHGITPLQIPSEFPFFSSGFVDEFSPDLDRGIFLAVPALEPGHPNVEDNWNLYQGSGLLEPGGASMQLLSDSVTDIGAATIQPNIKLAGSSADLSHVIFETKSALTPDATGTDPSLPKLYEWANGEVRLVGILPDGACGSPPCIAAGSLAGRGVSADVVDDDPSTYTTHTISTNGSRIFFTAPPFSINGGTGLGKFGTIHLREGGATTLIASSAKFLDATPDGSFVFFVTDEQLNGEDINSSHDIYRYEVDGAPGDRLTLISEDENSLPSSAIPGAYVIGTSEDGEYVYFVSENELVPGQPSVTELGSKQMLFAWHDGDVRFVGVGPSVSDWGNTSAIAGGILGNPSFNFKATWVTPDGKHLGFPSTSSWLSDATAGFDNHSKECFNGNPCQQIYTYSYDADELECASCAPSKEAPTGDAWPMTYADISLSALTTQHVNQTVSEDGRWVFFSSPDRLVFRDTNGRYDAYRYDTTTGRVALLSSGECNCDSFFVESSPDGKDAFFTTRERLVAIDFDNDADLYDARVGGGIAAQNVVPGPQCEGDSCLPPAAVPNFPTPASAGFKGQGNVKPEPSTRCRGGKVRRGKRCVSKRSQAKKRACRKRAGQAKRRCARANRNRGGAK